MKPTISRSIAIAASAHAVWSIVSDLPRMGEFSPENVGGYWTHDSGGPAIGATLRGFNHNGSLRWSTKVTVVTCVVDRVLVFDVRTPFGMRVSRWSYEIAPTETGCLLTENWYRVGNPLIQRVLGPRVTGRADRPGYNAFSIEHTLAAVKTLAER